MPFFFPLLKQVLHYNACNYIALLCMKSDCTCQAHSIDHFLKTPALLLIFYNQNTSQYKLPQGKGACLGYLQDEDEEVHCLAPLVDVVLWTALVAVVKLDFLDHVWVLEDPQKNLL